MAGWVVDRDGVWVHVVGTRGGADADDTATDQSYPIMADFERATVIQRLPKTRSGKVLRATLSKIADGEARTMPATIDDPAILDEITEALRQLGYAGDRPLAPKARG